MASSSRPSTALALGSLHNSSTVHVVIDDFEFDVPVSSSAPTSSAGLLTPRESPQKHSQSVRWLVNAALNQYSAAIRSAGSIRCREIPSSTDGVVGVSSVTAEYNDMLVGPDLAIDKLVDQLLEAGGPEAVQAGLRIHLPSKPGSKAPHQTTLTTPLWHSLAYSFSKPTRQHAELLLHDYQKHVEAQAAADAQRREAENAESMQRLARLLTSDADDPETVERNFIFDWSNVRVGSITNNPDQARRLRREMYKWYPAICDLFRHFSGGSSKGSMVSMQRQELQHMLFLCNGIDILRDRKLMDKLFDKANSARGGVGFADDKDPDSLARYEMLEFLCLLADAKYGQEIDTKTGEVTGAGAALARFIAEKLAPLIGKMNAGPVRAALKETPVHKFLLPRLPHLMTVYTYYASLDDEDGPPRPPTRHAATPGANKHGAGSLKSPGAMGSLKSPNAVGSVNTGFMTPAHDHGAPGGRHTPPPLMNLTEFITLLEHAGLLDDVTVMTTSAKEGAAAQLKTAKATLTAQEVRESFSGVQREDDSSGAADQQEELTYGEFLEAIGRVAIAKWGDGVGLKYVMDPRITQRQAAAAAAGGLASSGGDVFAKQEKALVRSLIMWAYSAVCDLEDHLGHAVPAPVQYDTAELVRLIQVGLPDQAAAASSMGRGVKAQMGDASEAERVAAQAKKAYATPGVAVFAAAHPRRPKSAFGNSYIPTEQPGRVATALGGSRPQFVHP